MTTEVGLRTQYLNWRASASQDWGIIPEWIVLEWWRDDGLIERFPGIPRKLKSRIRASRELRLALQRDRFDALFLAVLSVFQFQSHLLSRQPYFVTLDSTQLQQYQFVEVLKKRPSKIRAVERQKHAWLCQVLQNASALFPWSSWAAGSLIEDYGVDADRVHIIPPGLDLSQWQAPDRSRRSGPTRILFVGGLFRNKGGDLLLDWAARTRMVDWELHLVTRDAVRPAMDNVYVHNGLSANDPALVQLYRSADFFVLPTRADCYGLACVEAMAAGLPVVVSRTGGTGDIVREGVTGFLVPSGDFRGLHERLDWLVDHPEARLMMGDAARADAEVRYDASRNTLRTVTLMRSALAA